MHKISKYLKTNVFGLDFANPLIAASGCFGFGWNYQDLYHPSEWGGIALKALTLEERVGNAGTRAIKLDRYGYHDSWMNSVGLKNPGYANFMRDLYPKVADLKTVVLANINGNTIDDYVALAQKMNQLEHIDIVEVNVSCPNVGAKGVSFGIDPDAVYQLIVAVRQQLPQKPMIVKLTPNVADIVPIGQAVERAGADGIALINSWSGLILDPTTLKPIFDNVSGGVSGPILKPVGLRQTYQLAATVQIPLIGIGGISCAQDVLEYLACGASLVQVGAAIYNNPLVHREIIKGLIDYCEEHHLESIYAIQKRAH